MKIEVGIGEILDKATILMIKFDRINDPEKHINVFNELKYISSVCSKDILDSILAKRLLQVNQQLWDIEDKIRDCERLKIFDSVFIELARSVYKTNDLRAKIKKEINIKYGSNFVEEKSYAIY